MKTFLKNALIEIREIGRYLIVVSLGYALCLITHIWKPKDNVQKTKTIKETSVALNERGELLLIDRNSGVYTVYQDSIGKSIFNLYAISMESLYKEKTK